MRHLKLLSCALGLVLVACVGPPLRLEPKDGAMEVDVQQLGEYPSTISHIKVVDVETHETVWEVVAINGGFGLWRFTLRPGGNSSRLDGVSDDEARILMPANASPFLLNERIVYKITIWGTSGFSADRRFVLPPDSNDSP